MSPASAACGLWGSGLPPGETGAGASGPGVSVSRSCGTGASMVLKISFSFSAASGEDRPTRAEIAAKPKKLACARSGHCFPPDQMG